ncbi:hypothetical protein [Curtobacterium sp. ISL-83]|uniref:hypothetical protein n=1 Tax=Curtobacterium sp. ISL-83 TaxID=2819145 RepID=UPI001BEBADCA|nr:hypothetical protein [Curtobacterium sp. ISL-83]MBT2504162.1 hypothetical protein [Curtobacterium sp. ISL-83]
MLDADVTSLDALTADEAVIRRTGTVGGDDAAAISKADELAAYRGDARLQRFRVLAGSSAARGTVGQTRMLADARIRTADGTFDLVIESERQWERREGCWQLVGITARATARRAPNLTAPRLQGVAVR